MDDRQDDKFTAAIREFSAFDVRVKHLQTGDLVFESPYGRVGIEDKAMADLKASVRNGRLDDELRRLVEAYAVPVLFVRGIEGWGPFDHPWGDVSIQKVLFSRQLHGVYVWRTAGQGMLAAVEGLLALHSLLTAPHEHGIEGVMRPAKANFQGPMSGRAEVIYGILGLAGGVKDRRSVAERIANVCQLHDFLRWTESDFLFAGFTRHMARKLSALIGNLNEGGLTHGAS